MKRQRIAFLILVVILVGSAVVLAAKELFGPGLSMSSGASIVLMIMAVIVTLAFAKKIS